MDILLYIIIGVLIGGFCLYFYLRPKIKNNQELDKNIIKQNEINKEIFDNLQQEINILNNKKEEIKNSIKDLQEQAEESVKSLYEKSYELASTQLEHSVEKMSNKYQQAQKEAEEEYLNTLTECLKDFTFEIENKQKELNKIENQLKDIQSKVDNAVEAAKRAEELRQEKDFYKLQLSDIDIQEIEKLREVAPYLRDSEPLNKVIWKVYYEKPYSDLIGRIIGNNVYSGIYKITNIENEMCYVGQAVKNWPMKNFSQLLLGVY